MAGRKDRNQHQKGKRKVATQQVDQHQQSRQQQRQQDQQQLASTASIQSNQSGQSAQSLTPVALQDDSIASNASQGQRTGREQPAAKKIIKAEIDESRTLKHVFKSNPDSQMKDFINKAAKPSQQPATKLVPKTPADAHPPAVAQELLETDDDVADNLGKLFKASKSYKNS